MNQDKIKMREKLSFAMANFGNIPVMTLINGYLLIFYTNICGLSPAACATLFLIARFLDAINDPLVGFIIDHLPTIKPQMENSYSVKELFKILSQKPVYITFLAVLLYSIGSNIVNAANTYFYTYIFEDLTLASIITLITCVAVFPATMVIGNLIGRFGKKKMYAIGLALAGLAPIIRLLDVRSIPLLIVSVLIAGIGAGFAAPLNYGIQADNTDYIEVSMGIRAEGAVASLSSFVSKCAMGIGGAIPGYLLQLAGFDSKAAVQNDDVINVIVLCVLILPAIVNVVAIVIFSKGYPITKEKLNEQICLMREKRSKAGISE